jgi:hypothetical protein
VYVDGVGVGVAEGVSWWHPPLQDVTVIVEVMLVVITCVPWVVVIGHTVVVV